MCGLCVYPACTFRMWHGVSIQFLLSRLSTALGDPLTLFGWYSNIINDIEISPNTLRGSSTGFRGFPPCVDCVCTQHVRIVCNIASLVSFLSRNYRYPLTQVGWYSNIINDIEKSPNTHSGSSTGLGDILSRVEFITLQQHDPLTPCDWHSDIIFNIIDDVGIPPKLCCGIPPCWR